MTEDFSSAPLVVDGVTVTPTWPWSREYRAEVAAGMRATGKTHVSAHDAEQRYVEWFAAKHGLTHHQARQRIKGGAAA